MESVAAQYPQAKSCRITVANFSLEEASGLIDVHQEEALRMALQKIILKRQGGFDLERVIKNELYRYTRQLEVSSLETDWQIYPVFVVITPNKINIGDVKDVDSYRNIMPESGYYLIVSSGSDVEKKPLWSRTNSIEESDVTVVKHGAQVSFLSANGGQVASFPASAAVSGSNEFLAYDPNKNQFVSLGAVKNFSDQGAFINKLSLQWSDRRASLNPASLEASLSDSVKESRRLSVLIPSTSFIVVERSAQWKALQINEKKRLKTSNAFEFEEEFKTPAPAFWLLVVIFAVFLAIKQWRFGVLRGKAMSRSEN
jgi:hypothetical protein